MSELFDCGDCVHIDGCAGKCAKAPKPAMSEAGKMADTVGNIADAYREHIGTQAFAALHEAAELLRSQEATTAEQAKVIEGLREALKFYACDGDACDCAKGHEQADLITCGFRARAAMEGK